MLQPGAVLLAHYWKAENELRRERLANSYGRPGPRRGVRVLSRLRRKRRDPRYVLAA
ncbi:MAG TPA: hypothetical protein VFT75_14865 [Nocardioidaceae bacterium]|jgi:hypothetical protein|nr:hypothetical protein [Nocardioidaceae bacterium]